MVEKQLTAQAREARNRYQREYRKQNRAKIREIERRYWERKASADKSEVMDDAEAESSR